MTVVDILLPNNTYKKVGVFKLSDLNITNSFSVVNSDMDQAGNQFCKDILYQLCYNNQATCTGKLTSSSQLYMYTHENTVDPAYTVA